MRSRQLFPYAVSLLGLLLGLWGMQGQVRLAMFPRQWNPERLHFPVALEGRPVGSADELRFRVQSLAPGGTVRIDTGGPTEAVVLDPQLNPLQRFVTLAGGLFFFAITFFVFCSRTDRGAVRDFFWATLLFGLAILIGGVARPPGALWPGVLRPLIWVLALSLLPLLFLHMSLSFPRRHRVLERWPWLPSLLVALSVALCVAQSAAALRYFHAPTEGTWRAYAMTRILAQLYLVIGVASGCAVLYQSSRRLELTREREQTKWLLWGITLGVTPYVFLRTLPRIFGVEPPLGVEIDRTFELAIPIAFTFAVVRYKFLDIDIIIRRSLIYTFLAGVMVGIYVLLAVLLGRWIRVQVPSVAPFVPFVAAAVPLALFAPTRRTIGRWVDRTFFKIRYGHGQALRTLKEELPTAASQEELAAMVAALIERHLQPKRLRVLLNVGGSVRNAAGTDDDAARLMAAIDPLTSVPPRPVAAPNATSLPEIEQPDFPGELQRAEIQLAVPLTTHAVPFGWVLLGEKRAERRYIEQDIALLESAATEAAIALERIALVQRVAAEASERRRLDEIDRLKSDFLSRVSHDLRTPITSISWSTQNLLDGLAGEPNAKQQEYLEAIRSSAHQLQRLVNNLLEISRLELATSRVQLGPVDLGAVVEESLRGLKPLAARREVGFDLRLAPDLAPVCGDHEKLLEIVANLIDNAIKYSPNGSTVEITLERAEPGREHLVVRDRGPGIAEGENELIFDRFRQGRPSPYAEQSGFGLGLYVVRSFLSLMDGTVRAENHPQGGARFVCALPIWGTPESGHPGG